MVEFASNGNDARGYLALPESGTGPGVIVVQGQIPIDQPELLRTFQVEDPPSFARTLLIEALQRQGVTVDTSPTGDNPAAQLPPAGSYAEADRVALHTSLPFSEK